MHQKSVTDVDRAIGQRIRAMREVKGLSQATLATLIGLTFQQVQKYEKNRNRVNGSRLREIARALDVPVSALFDEAEAGEAGSEALAFLSTPWRRRVAADLRCH